MKSGHGRVGTGTCNLFCLHIIFFAKCKTYLKKTSDGELRSTTVLKESYIVNYETAVEKPKEANLLIAPIGIDKPNQSGSNTESTTTTQNTSTKNGQNSYSRYHPFGYNNKKIYNPKVENGGTVFLHTSQINELFSIPDGPQLMELPILTLSMARILTVSALPKKPQGVFEEIKRIAYIMKQNYKAYKSHRKRIMLTLASRDASYA